MRKTKLYIAIFFSVISFFAKAEGIPVDSNGNITVEHVNILLTEKQIEELEVGRFLVLTENQLKNLKGIWESKEVRILDPHHDDCTCDLDYAIWSSPNKISFLKTPLDEQYHDSICSQERQEYEEYLYLGINGDVYYKKKKILNQELEKLIVEILKHKEFILVYIAPFKDNPQVSELKKTIQIIKNIKDKEHKMYLM